MYIRNGELVIISRHKKRFSFFRSLRFRIFVIMIILSVIPTIIVERSIVSSYEDRAISSRSAIVKNQCTILCDQLLADNYLENQENEVINSELELLTNIYGGRIQIIDGDYRVVRDTFGMNQGKYMISSELIDCMKGFEFNNYDSGDRAVEMGLKITDPNSKDVIGAMLVSFSTQEINNNREILNARGLMILGLIVAAICVFGLLMSRFLVLPFRKITKAIDMMTTTYQDEYIYVDDYQETEQISDAFNRLITQVRRLDDSRTEFVSNVSHELKTPLASMKVLADSLLMNPDVTLEQYKEFMQDISQEIDRENAIINDLLSIVSMDKNVAKLNIEKTNINELTAQVIKRLKPIADGHKVELTMDNFRTVEAEVDPVKLTLVISNIIDNGIKYNKPEGGWVRVILNADNKYFFLTISDSGIGIPKDSQEKIFDRFYRVDKSHSREIGGTGLGLAITKSAISMHKGAIRVTSEEGEGTTFFIRIPLNYVP